MPHLGPCASFDTVAPMSALGPASLFVAWALHDVEEAVAFPATCDALADRTGVESLRIDARQSWTAVGVMGLLVATACWRGVRTNGRSQLYRATVAGLEAHVLTHLAASVVHRGYTAGLATAVPVMLTGARIAHHKVNSAAKRLGTRDFFRGAVLLIPAAIACQALVRFIPKAKS